MKYTATLIVKPNKYSGECACGTHVPAGLGTFIAGLGIRCTTDLQATEPGGLPHACPNQIAEHKTHLARLAANPAGITHVTHNAPGECGKCAGTGTYRYSNGDLGECYPCEGTGRLEEVAS